jgi:hypothetical protein
VNDAASIYDPHPAKKKAHPIALAEWANVTDAQKIDLANQLFLLAEYGVKTNLADSDGPGVDWDSDFVQDLGSLFGSFGVKHFTAPDDRPYGYRFTDHKTATGAWCHWSKCSVASPHLRSQPGDLLCPARCADSSIETDPNAGPDTEELVDVEVVLQHLRHAGVPYDVADTSGGTFTAYIGAGEWDEATERRTQPMILGPIYQRVYQRAERYVGYKFELSYGSNTSVEHDIVVEDDTDPERVAAGIVELYLRTAGQRMTVKTRELSQNDWIVSIPAEHYTPDMPVSVKHAEVSTDDLLVGVWFADGKLGQFDANIDADIIRLASN